MSIFSKTPAVDPNYPRGYNDQMSDFFIPENLRGTWIQQSIGSYVPIGTLEYETRNAARIVADTEAFRDEFTSKHGPRPEVGEFSPARLTSIDAASKRQAAWDERLRTELTARADLLLSTDWNAVRDRVVHRLRIEKAADVYRTELEQERSRRARLAASACPVCGETDARRNGPIATRALLPGLPVHGHLATQPHPVIRSCATCHALACEEYLRHLPDRETRIRLVASLVRAQLERYIEAVEK